MTKLYRAAAKPTAKRGAHFSPDRGVAFAYTDNPGFGGQHVYVYDVVDEYRLDLFRISKRSGDRAALEAMAEDLEYADPRDVVRGWRDAGHVYVFQVLENDRNARERAQQSYDWISFVDDFPPGAETWRYLGSETLEGQLVKPDKGRLDEDIRRELDAENRAKTR